jgi:mannose-6-phosphate isomerase-like protein (cupin superfamily)
VTDVWKSTVAGTDRIDKIIGVSFRSVNSQFQVDKFYKSTFREAKRMMNPSSVHTVEIKTWEGEGYHPLVADGEWLVALMNWEQRFDLSSIGKIERHNETDEVFVLLQGNSILYIKNEDGLHTYVMKPGVVYNVTKATWHNVVGSRDATWLIVENKNTTVENSNYDTLPLDEITTVRDRFSAEFVQG